MTASFFRRSTLAALLLCARDVAAQLPVPHNLELIVREARDALAAQLHPTLPAGARLRIDAQ
ncbi:MAG: hypothetical protein NZM12_14020, partial [Steroidobacteraceae bacterium]|nr:hypothetical protein [Steroidobacteraceae bacterium]